MEGGGYRIPFLGNYKSLSRKIPQFFRKQAKEKKIEMKIYKKIILSNQKVGSSFLIYTNNMNPKLLQII